MADETVGFASINNRRGFVHAWMFRDGRIVLARNGDEIWRGKWSADAIEIPLGLIDASDRALLLERLRTSVGATGEVLLYHYRPLRGPRGIRRIVDESITIIRNESFHFSDPAEFKDQADCRLEWCLDLSTAEEEKFLRWWLRKDFVGKELEVQVVLHLVAQTIRLRFDRVYRPEIETMAAASRMLCLTTTPDHPRMWREYADDFSGVCFELGFPANKNGPLAALPVEYRPSRTIKLTADPLTMARGLFLTKTEAHRWEDEYRCIHTSQTSIPDERLRHMRGVVRGVILGPNVDTEHRDEILRAVNDHRPIPVRHAQLLGDGRIALTDLYAPSAPR